MWQVDGDTDNVSVQREFERVIRQHTTRLGHTAAYKVQLPQQQQQTNIADRASSNRRSANVNQLQHDTIDLEDLDNVPGTVPTISNHISLIQNNKGSNEPDNNNLNNYANHANKTNNMINNTSNKHNNNNHTDANGMLPAGGATAAANGPKTFRSMLEEAETYPIDL